MKGDPPAPESLYAVSAVVDRAQAQEVAAWIEEAWALSVVQFEQPLVGDCRLDMYVPTATEAELVRHVLAGRPDVKAAACSHLGHHEWEEIWKAHFRRHLIGRRLEICPDWEAEHPVPEGRQRILVHPGMSFGTGEHFTTRFCLEMLDGLCDLSAPESLLDVGTGSGILAIAAAKLGVARVAGTDSDTLAVETAAQNAVRNGVEGIVAFSEADITVDPPGGPYEVVCANLYAGILIDAAAVLVRAASRRLVISGVRDVEVDGVADTFVNVGAREIVRDGEGEWTGLLLATDR